mmetsp:Transcript_21991/g.50544  ORF Transcript_21991/g.50544 Transcript_21991/m.50544 type:complete len:236 (+) Transcript_21991:733-1440(+)
MAHRCRRCLRSSGAGHAAPSAAPLPPLLPARQPRLLLLHSCRHRPWPRRRLWLWLRLQHNSKLQLLPPPPQLGSAAADAQDFEEEHTPQLDGEHLRVVVQHFGHLSLDHLSALSPLELSDDEIDQRGLLLAQVLDHFLGYKRLDLVREDAVRQCDVPLHRRRVQLGALGRNGEYQLLQLFSTRPRGRCSHRNGRGRGRGRRHRHRRHLLCAVLDRDERSHLRAVVDGEAGGTAAS